MANPVLAWGGHISTRADWGQDNSAVAISGSPYHMRLIDLDGSGGNQDRSLSADAVIFPGSITIIKNAIPDDPQDFSFTTTGGLTPSTFALDDDADTPPCPTPGPTRPSPRFVHLHDSPRPRPRWDPDLRHSGVYRDQREWGQPVADAVGP